jgi:hypothetical protein
LIFINFRALLDREGAWGIFYIVSSEKPKFILGGGLLYASVTIPLSLTYSGKRLSEIQTKPCLAWFIARDTVPHTTAHRYVLSFHGREIRDSYISWS